VDGFVQDEAESKRAQNHGPVVHPWYHRDMDAGDHLSMHARDDTMVNKRHRMHANHQSLIAAIANAV
jgi:hypothetical protein